MHQIKLRQLTPSWMVGTGYNRDMLLKRHLVKLMPSAFIVCPFVVMIEGHSVRPFDDKMLTPGPFSLWTSLIAKILRFDRDVIKAFALGLNRDHYGIGAVRNKTDECCLAIEYGYHISNKHFTNGFHMWNGDGQRWATMAPVNSAMLRKAGIEV
jgi:hypothetical protein